MSRLLIRKKIYSFPHKKITDNYDSKKYFIMTNLKINVLAHSRARVAQSIDYIHKSFKVTDRLTND